VKQGDRAKRPIKQLKQLFLEANQPASRTIAELGSLCATYHTVLVDAQATASRISTTLTQAAAQASSHTTQQRTLLKELSVLRRQARSSHRNFQELKSTLLQQLDASCDQEHKHLQSISELENRLASAVKEEKRLWT
jgi:septal ring factor EnvC (AmiA/AmiB activator)